MPCSGLSVLLERVELECVRLHSPDCCAAAGFRPPRRRPSDFLCLPRESNQREGTPAPRIACGASDVPCVARQPAAGADSAIHGLEHSRLSPPLACATRRGAGGVKVKSKGKSRSRSRHTTGCRASEAPESPPTPVRAEVSKRMPEPVDPSASSEQVRLRCTKAFWHALRYLSANGCGGFQAFVGSTASRLEPTYTEPASALPFALVLSSLLLLFASTARHRAEQRSRLRGKGANVRGHGWPSLRRPEAGE